MLDARLTSEIEIIHLIYVKFNDQQRHQRWWRYVAILHRRLWSMLRHAKLDVKSAHFIQKRLVPGAARALQSVLAQGAFITLGFALTAALARVSTLLTELAPLPVLRPLPPAPIIREPEDDLGEPVEEAPDASKTVVQGTAPIKPATSSERVSPEPAPRKSEKKHRKSKKKRDAIDDIFG